MNRLPEHVKRRIIEHLACYQTASEVVELIRQEFDITLTPRHVRAYDPSSFQCVASTRLREYHALVRQRLANEVAEIPIAHRAFRLRRLNQIHDRAMDIGNFSVAREALEQAAKEVGGMFTHHHIATIATARR